MSLNGKQRRFLRALGHALQPIVHVGSGGLTPGVAAALDQALLDHELVKVRLGQNALVERSDAAGELATMTDSEVAQVLGNTVLLYRRHPDKPRIRLPRR